MEWDFVGVQHLREARVTESFVLLTGSQVVYEALGRRQVAEVVSETVASELQQTPQLASGGRE